MSHFCLCSKHRPNSRYQAGTAQNSAVFLQVLEEFAWSCLVFSILSEEALAATFRGLKMLYEFTNFPSRNHISLHTHMLQWRCNARDFRHHNNTNKHRNFKFIVLGSHLSSHSILPSYDIHLPKQLHVLSSVITSFKPLSLLYLPTSTYSKQSLKHMLKHLFQPPFSLEFKLFAGKMPS